MPLPLTGLGESSLGKIWVVLIGIPEPFNKIATVIIVLFVVIFLIRIVIRVFGMP